MMTSNNFAISQIDAVLAKGNFQIKTRHSNEAEIDQSHGERFTDLVGQLWDPIGLVLPVAIKFRIDPQELWSLGYKWDDILPANIQSKWIENAQTINHLLAFEFDRKLKPSHAIGLP